MKYIILANSNDSKKFNKPRQLSIINGEPLVVRTIRLLKENGVDDILITASSELFDNLGALRYKPKYSNYDYAAGIGYWLNAFPFELMNEPVCFIWGDVYFSEEAIKTIVETETDSTLFFCTYNNQSELYIKKHDEPLAYKVVDTALFKKHINRVKKLFDEGKTCRHPIVWEVYRSINGLDINEHIMTENFVAINDISCDIDSIIDIEKIKIKLGDIKMITVEALQDFSLRDFNKVEELKRKGKEKDGFIFKGDTFKCDEKMCEYLCGKNPLNKAVVQVVEVIPETKKEIKKEPKTEIKEEVVKSKKTTKKKSSKK